MLKYIVLGCLIGYFVSFAFPSSPSNTENRIVGGSTAKDGSAPYMASLTSTLLGSHFCGGSIINKRWVITAAHCAKMFPANLVQVVVGTNHIFEFDGTVYDAEKIIVHEKYAPIGTHEHDIALIKVTRDMVFTDRVQPINPSKITLTGGEKLRITGWGLLNSNSIIPPDDLQELTVNALSTAKCTEAAGFKPTTHICTFTKLGQGVCMGDSGSPLTYNGEQVGIASFVLNDCAAGLPDVFTRTSLYNDWIQKHAVV